MIDDLGLVLGGDAGQVLPLGRRDAELLASGFDRLGDHVPVLLLLACRLDVVVDVVEIDRVQGPATAPLRDGLA